MESILNFSPDQYFNYFLIMLRVGGLFVTAPILSSDTVPRQLRAGLALFVGLILFMALPLKPIYADWTPTAFFLIAIRETMIGLLLGVVPRLLFAAIDFAGTVIGFQMGLSLANVVDPQPRIQTSLIASFDSLVATLFFVVIDGHHIFFEVMATSYEQIPLGGFTFEANKIDFLLRLTANMILLGLQLGAPLIVALLMANVILGFMARAMPQMNIFIVGIPVTILIGFVIIAFGMPYLTGAIHKSFNTLGSQVLELIGIMAH